MNFLDQILSQENFCEKFFESPKRKFLLYGCGGGCQEALNMFAQHGMKPEAICDSSSKKWGSTVEHIPVMQFDEALRLIGNSDFFIYISAPAHIHQIFPILAQKCDEAKLYYFGWDQLINPKRYKEFIRNNAKELLQIRTLWEDDFSRKTMDAVCCARASCDYRYFKEVYQNNQYFPSDIIHLTNREIFLDVGAYTGDTIEKFIKQCDNSYEKIIALEPNPDCTSALQNISHQYQNIQIITQGASNQYAKLLFKNDNQTSSQSQFISRNIGENTSDYIETNAIDHLVNEKVTMIKMDIEGMECAALSGAQNTIKKYKPVLAICVYHKWQDIIEITNWINNLNLGYRFFLRHHTYYTGETVLYAI